VVFATCPQKVRVMATPIVRGRTVILASGSWLEAMASI
jgi:hypothetical protein